MDNPQKQKIGAGIITISIITLVINVLLLVLPIFALIFKDKLNAQLIQQGINSTYSSNELIPLIIIGILEIISIILILLRNTIGVFSYFIICIGNIVYSIVQSGFKSGTLATLILPTLMAIFICPKIRIFKIKNKKNKMS